LSGSGTHLVITGQNQTGLASGPAVTLFPDCPCRQYEHSLDANLEHDDPARAKEFLGALGSQPDIELTASPLVATSLAMVDGKPHIFLANFSGLRSGANAVPTPQKDIALRLQNPAKVHYLPFLGDVQVLRGTPDRGGYLYHLPEVSRGGVVWIEK